jgi:hypothetical protein
MLFSALTSVLSVLFEFIVTLDLRWGTWKAYLTDTRMVTLQLRESWGCVSLAIFMSRGALPANHPYRDVACGFAAAYLASKIAFDVYHAMGTLLLCLALGLRRASILIATVVQLFEPIAALAMFISLASITAMFTPEMPNGEAMSIALKAMRWSFTGIDCPLGVGGALATALLLRAVEHRMGYKTM